MAQKGKRLLSDFIRNPCVLLRSDIASYSPEDVYKPREGVDGVKGPAALTWGHCVNGGHSCSSLEMKGEVAADNHIQY